MPRGSQRWPAAVLVAGPAGSGKTTLASAIADAAGHVLLDLDAVTGALTRAALELCGVGEDALDRPGPGRALRAGRYGSLVDTAVSNLGLGWGVVLAAPFTAECTDAGRYAALAARLATAATPAGAPPCGDVALVYVDTPAPLRRERLARRAAPRDAAKLAEGRLPASSPPACDHLRIDGATPISAQLDAVRLQMRQVTGGRPCPQDLPC